MFDNVLVIKVMITDKYTQSIDKLIIDSNNSISSGSG